MLSLPHRQTMVTILLPQAVTIMLSTIIPQIVIALKDSVLNYMTGYIEVVRLGH